MDFDLWLALWFARARDTPCILFFLLCFCFRDIYEFISNDVNLHSINSSAYILILYNITVIILFTFIYYFLEIFSTTSHFFVGDKPIKITLFDSFYATIVTQTTVGYGYFHMRTVPGRILNIIQMLTIIVNVALLPIIHNTISLTQGKKKDEKQT